MTPSQKWTKKGRTFQSFSLFALLLFATAFKQLQLLKPSFFRPLGIKCLSSYFRHFCAQIAGSVQTFRTNLLKRKYCQDLVTLRTREKGMFSCINQSKTFADLNFFVFPEAVFSLCRLRMHFLQNEIIVDLCPTPFSNMRDYLRLGREAAAQIESYFLWILCPRKHMT